MLTPTQMQVAMQDAGITKPAPTPPARKGRKTFRVGQVFTKVVELASTVGKVTHYREATINACRTLGQIDLGTIQGVGRFRSAIPNTRRV